MNEDEMPPKPEPELQGGASYAEYMERAGYQEKVEEGHFWEMGMVLLAVSFLSLLGCFHLIAGFVAILDDSFFPREDYFDEISVSTWGWVHVIAGIAALAASFGLIVGAMWARVTGVVIAAASALVNFVFLPHYPVWSALMIVFSLGVIWALVAYGGAMAEWEDEQDPSRP